MAQDSGQSSTRGVKPIAAIGEITGGASAGYEGGQRRSQEAYQDFLAAWKEADPDVPVLLEAKAEYGKMK